MPEAPDLEIIKESLKQRVQGWTIESSRVLRPTVLRGLAGDFPKDIVGRQFGQVRRNGKFLLTPLSEDRRLVINPMLTGAIQLYPSSLRVLKNPA